MTESDKKDSIPEESLPGYVRDEFKVASSLSDTTEYWISGNHIERIAKILLAEHSSERVEWMDATYIEKFNITRMNILINPEVHKVSLLDILKGYDFYEIDYSNMDARHRINSDDLLLLEQTLGLL